MEVSGYLHAQASLPPGKELPPYPLNRRLGGSQRRSGRCGEEKNISILIPSPIHSTDKVVLEDESLSASHMYRLLWNPKVHYLVHKILSLDSILSHLHPFHIPHYHPPVDKSPK
jgi:hypothetical protein